MKDIHVNVENGSFDKLIRLQTLDLSSNLIEHLPSNIFQHNTKLDRLDLSGNCLGKIVLNPTFVPRQISNLFLGHNRCFIQLTKNNFTAKL